MGLLMEAVNIVTINQIMPLFKLEEPATNIELITFKENVFQVVSQKGLYKPGEKAVFIQPNYCLPNLPLFEFFINPVNGNCKLGSNNRIKAIKFNFHIGDNNTVYSQGILLTHNLVETYIKSLGLKTSPIDGICSWNNLTKLLKIEKWEAPEEKSGGGVKGGASKPFPEGMYRTDEENINNLWNYLELQWPLTLILTEKVDGSSISIWSKEGKTFGITSRNLSKPLAVKHVTGKRNRTFFEWLFRKKVDLNIYTETTNNSDFVEIGLPYLQKLNKYCSTNKVNLCLRGELRGQSLKGSGNKNNPAAKLPKDISFYGVDLFNDETVKLEESHFSYLCDTLNLNRCEVITNAKIFNSRQELEDFCNKYFKTNLIKGIVCRTLDSRFSAKIMNPEYDSKK